MPKTRWRFNYTYEEIRTNDELDGRIHAGRFDYSAGGVARNMCEALSKLNCPSHFISAIGDDHQGDILLKQIPKESRRFIAQLAGENTAQCVVVVDTNGDCRFLLGDMRIHRQISVEMIDEHEELMKNAPLIVMDGNIGTGSMGRVLEIGLKHNVPVFYEPTDMAIARKPFTTPHWRAIKCITPNVGELQDIATCLNLPTDCSRPHLDQVAEVAQHLACHIDNVLVTLGPQGMLLARKGRPEDPLLKKSTPGEIPSVRHYPVERQSDVVNVSGAGDCFASGFIAALLQGCSESQCVSAGFAAAVAALRSQSPVPKALLRSQPKEAKFVELFLKNRSGQ